MYKNIYDTKVHDFMFDEHFLIKWSVISEYIKKYCPSNVYRVLDLGCGQINALDYLPSAADNRFRKVETYIGIDHREEIVDWCNKNKFGTYYQSKFENFDIKKIESQNFNILLCTGFPIGTKQYPKIIKKYLPFLCKSGIVVFDYRTRNPNGIFSRIGLDLPLEHITGCELILKYIPNEKRTMEDINKRTIEVLRKT